MLLLAALATACATAVRDDEWRAAAAFVGAGRVTREELVGRFGPPHQTWEGGRIASWRVAYEPGAGLRRGDPSPFTPGPDLTSLVRRDPDATRPLVVVFDANGVVSRFSVVVP